MKHGVIKIFGDIGGQVNLVDVIAQVKAAGDVSEYVVFINSPGGFVNLGYDINSYLRGLGKPVTTIIDKQCSSIATVIALAGNKGSRLIIASSEFMVHNPWTMEMGDASQLADTAEQLQKVEDELIKFYSTNTGISEEGIRPLMKAETFLSAEDAVRLGFADRVITQEEANKYGVVTDQVTAKAYAKFNPKNTPMKTEKTENTEAKKIFEGVMAMFTKAFKKDAVKALDLKTDAGKTITLEKDPADPTPDMPAVGDVITVDGQPATETSYTLVDGTVINVDAKSTITEVIPPVDGKTSTANLAKIKTLEDAVKAKDAEIEKLKVEQTKTLENITAIETKLIAFGKLIKSEHTPDQEDTQFRSNKKNESDDIIARMEAKNKTARKKIEAQ